MEIVEDFLKLGLELEEIRLNEEGNLDGLPRVSKAMVNEYAENIEAIASKLAVSMDPYNAIFMVYEVTKDDLFSVAEMEYMVSYFSYLLLILTSTLFGGLDKLYEYLRKQADDSEKLNKKLAEMIVLMNYEEQSDSSKNIKFDVTPELKDILRSMNCRVKSIYSELPLNAMLIICTGHGDTAIVQR
ncbi:hypothetical protein CQW23_10245 [Capsicum baccatum]|uniref:Uncharacterized protein n=1 Tax=Capsicum baccatum TaxID=33114 RepID=A0A2G2WZ26_CAPBA|nr:hypothetical protein CQW23_10245 [Capsicum baccatum]